MKSSPATFSDSRVRYSHVAKLVPAETQEQLKQHRCNSHSCIKKDLPSCIENVYVGESWDDKMSFCLPHLIIYWCGLWPIRKKECWMSPMLYSMWSPYLRDRIMESLNSKALLLLKCHPTLESLGDMAKISSLVRGKGGTRIQVFWLLVKRSFHFTKLLLVAGLIDDAIGKC